MASLLRVSTAPTTAFKAGLALDGVQAGERDVERVFHAKQVDRQPVGGACEISETSIDATWICMVTHRSVLARRVFGTPSCRLVCYLDRS